MKENGLEVLRLPPYSQEFIPIEKIWGITKNWIATHNVTFRLQDVEELARKKFAEIPPETFTTCRSVIKIEKEFLEKEHCVDAALENLQFRCFSSFR